MTFLLSVSILALVLRAEAQEGSKGRTERKTTKITRARDQEIAELRRLLVEVEQKKNQEIAELKARLSALEYSVQGQHTAHERMVPTSVVDTASGAPVLAAPAGTSAPITDLRKTESVKLHAEEGTWEQTRQEVADLQKHLPFTLSADTWLYYFQPLKKAAFGGDNAFELYSFYLNIKKEWNNFGFSASLRFRDTKLRSWHPSNIYAREIYGTKQTPLGLIKVGTFFKQVGYFWDDSFFGNVQYFDGLKLDPDTGIALEGERHLGQHWRLPYFFQFFLTSDGYHGGLTKRDAESSPGTREKNTGVIRIIPTFEFGQGRSLALGGSYLHSRINRPMGERDNDLTQLAADLELRWGPLLTYGEFLHQQGRNSVFFPRPGGSSSTQYWLAGARYDWGRFNWRMNFSLADYKGGIKEYIAQPGVVYSIAEGLDLWLEHDLWRHREGGRSRTVDQSLNAALYIHF